MQESPGEATPRRLLDLPKEDMVKLMRKMRAKMEGQRKQVQGPRRRV